MGGIYGKLLITAFIVFDIVIFGFIIMCMVLGKRNAEMPSEDISQKCK